MRKLLNIISLSTVVLLVSCEMDRLPQGYTGPENVFENIESIEDLERGAYARLRDNYIPSNVTTSDIQADYVQAITGYSGTYGDQYKWTFNQENADISSTWNQCYLTINQCNFILNNTDSLVEGLNSFEGEALTRLELVRGRVHLMRALSYSVLAERFCVDYDDATAKTEYSGVPLIERYNPDLKPGRATLFQVYDLIQKDIAAAKKALAGEKGAPNSIYFNIDCVTAFEAHVLLQMDLYREALAAANSLIKSGTYPLTPDLADFDNMWSYDKGSEIIFKFAGSKTELPERFGAPFFMDNRNGTGKDEQTGKKVYDWAPDYIPTQTLIDSFDADDYRRKAWFFAGYVDGGDMFQNFWAGRFVIQPGFILAAKFPGNPDLRVDNSWNYANVWKLFRIPEMYLIAAEAAAQSGGDAKTPLNELRKHRGVKALDNVTMKEVKEERYKELMLEGFRLTDLKRWKEGFTRGKSQFGTFYKLGPVDSDGKQYLEKQKEGDLADPTASDLTVEATNFRFIWPIPFSEIYSNQNLAGQQNPGWTR